MYRRAEEKGRQAFGTHMVYRETFLQIHMHLHQLIILNQWCSSTEETLHSPTVEKSERPEQNQDLRCKSGPSAKKSVLFNGGDSSKNYGADQQRLQISDLNLCLLEDMAQDRGMYLFAISYKSDAVDQRSGVG